LLAVCQESGIENAAIPRIASGFGGGIGGTGAVCGAVVGAVMAIGLKHGRDAASEDRFGTWRLVQEMGHICCHELTGVDLSTEEGQKQFWSSDVPIRVCLPAGGTAYRLTLELLEESS
jgi:C_GCAxxG_C_C family probable redox protein